MTHPEFLRLEDQAEAFVRKLGLPPCPEVLADISRETRREMPDVQRIAVLVARDVAVAASVLKTANSAYYGLVTKARTIQQGIAYLGLDRTALLLAELLLRNAFPKSSSTAMARFWELSTQLALTTAFLARVTGSYDRDEAHTYGLFREAGSAVLICKFDNYTKVEELARRGTIAGITEVEKAHFSVDHAVIGAVMARDWQLPEEMSEAILWHHAEFVLELEERPIQDEAARLIALGVLSDRVIARRVGEPPNEAIVQLTHHARRVIGLSEAQFDDLQVEAMTMLDDITGQTAATVRMGVIQR